MYSDNDFRYYKGGPYLAHYGVKGMKWHKHLKAATRWWDKSITNNQNVLGSINASKNSLPDYAAKTIAQQKKQTVSSVNKLIKDRDARQQNKEDKIEKRKARRSVLNSKIDRDATIKKSWSKAVGSEMKYDSHLPKKPTVKDYFKAHERVTINTRHKLLDTADVNEKAGYKENAENFRAKADHALRYMPNEHTKIRRDARKKWVSEQVRKKKKPLRGMTGKKTFKYRIKSGVQSLLKKKR